MAAKSAPNPPNELPGFGKLGRFCRDILGFAKSLRIESITIEEETKTGVPPKATIQSSPTGSRVTLRIGKSTSGGGSVDVAVGALSGGSVSELDGVARITFDDRYFSLTDNGGGEVIVTLVTTACP